MQCNIHSTWIPWIPILLTKKRKIFPILLHIACVILKKKKPISEMWQKKAHDIERKFQQRWFWCDINNNNNATLFTIRISNDNGFREYLIFTSCNSEQSWKIKLKQINWSYLFVCLLHIVFAHSCRDCGVIYTDVDLTPFSTLRSRSEHDFISGQLSPKLLTKRC